MDLQNSFVVPTDVETAWKTLLDVESVAPAMPGATLTAHEGDEFAGTVKVKLGPVSMTYNGTARFVEKNETERKAVIEASGKDTRGTSTARASVVTQLFEEGPDRTRVDVLTDLAITGRPAQFGRGVMQDVAGRIIDQFAANLSTLMSGPPQAPPSPAVAPPVADASGSQPDGAAGLDPPAEAGASSPRSSESVRPVAPMSDSIDLLDAAGAPVLKRLVPVGVAVVVIGLAWWMLRRRR